MQALLKINGQGHRNNDEDQDRGISPSIPIFNHNLKISNQRSPTVGSDDTSDEEADFGEFVNPLGKQIGGRQWQPNYRGDDEYKLKVDIPDFSGDLDIEGVFRLVY